MPSIVNAYIPINNVDSNQVTPPRANTPAITPSKGAMIAIKFAACCHNGIGVTAASGNWSGSFGDCKLVIEWHTGISMVKGRPKMDTTFCLSDTL
jgi:hypothetical protein